MNWLKHTYASRDESGRIQIEVRTLHLTRLSQDIASVPPGRQIYRMFGSRLINQVDTMQMLNIAMPEVSVAIVFHSGYGHTARQAEAVRRGAASVPGASVLVLTAEEALTGWDSLAKADAIVFGAPTYMGSVSASFKTFMEATSRVFNSGAWRDKIAAGFTNSASRSGDKLATLVQFAILAAQLGMHWVSLGVPAGNNQSTGSEDDLNRLGFWLGAAAQSNADEGPDRAPPASDLRTAELLGERVATVAQQMARGRAWIEQT